MTTSSSSSEFKPPLPLPRDHDFTLRPTSSASFGVKKNQIVSSPNEDADFLSNHLSSIPADFPWSKSVDEDKLNKVRECEPNGGEQTYYELFSELLTTLSEKIHASLEAKIKATSVPIVFIPNSKHSLTYHPAGDEPDSKSNFAPDVVGVPGPLKNYEQPGDNGKLGDGKLESEKYMTIPYPLVHTVIEMKTAEDSRAQTVLYPWCVFEACPHIVGMYVLSIELQYYRISWVDATGPISSPQYTLDNLTPLVSYLYSLYAPPKGHHPLDSTIRPHITSCDDLTKALIHGGVDGKRPCLKWNVTIGSCVYEDCHLRVWSDGFGRRTTIFQTQPMNANEQGFIIKDMYRNDKARRFSEQQILELVHSDGVVPGVVRLMAYEEVTNSVHGAEGVLICTVGTVTHQGKVAGRARTRLLLGSYGEPLSRARSLGDLLKAIYDVVEAHRAMVIERQILHWDVSVNNILIYPKHCTLSEGRDTTYFVPERPLRFIDDVLSSDASANKSGTIKSDTARCLIIDFDNSSPAHQDMIVPLHVGQQTENIPKSNDIQQALRERTGTPIFIARSVALGKTLPCVDYSIQLTPMPILKGEGKERYIAAYGAETYERWCDNVGLMHGGKPPADEDPNADIPFSHKPCHDVESIFWTLLYTLMKARPTGAPPEASLHWAVDVAKSTVLQHTIRGHSEPSTRCADDICTACLMMPRSTLDSTLHPALQGRGLGLLLHQLAKHVLPEYAYLDPPPAVDHLHEAFRRVLLNFIVDLDTHPDKDVSLDPDNSRPLVELTPDADDNSLGKRSCDDGSFVLPASKRARPYCNPEAEMNSFARDH